MHRPTASTMSMPAFSRMTVGTIREERQAVLSSLCRQPLSPGPRSGVDTRCRRQRVINAPSIAVISPPRAPTKATIAKAGSRDMIEGDPV
jgi:hypothetical protein